MRESAWYRRWWLIACLGALVAGAGPGCDSQAAQQGGEQTKNQQAGPPGWETEGADGESSVHQTDIGLAFELPDGWAVRSSPVAARLRPTEGAAADAKFMVILRFAPDDVDSPDDNDYLDELAGQFADRVPDATVADREVGLESKAGEGAVVAWDVPKEAYTKRVAFYVAIDSPWMILVRASGPRETIEDVDPTMREVLASAELRDADVDERLVGEWRRVEPKQNDGMALSQTLELRANGTMVLTTEPKAVSGSQTTRDLGRWTTRDQTMIQYAGNHREGGVWTAEKEWLLSEDEEMLRLKKGDEVVRWERH